MLGGGQQPLGDAVGALPLRDVQRGDDPVELVQQVVGQVERAVAHDVDLAARQQLEAVERLADAVHRLDLAAHVVGLEADAHAHAAGVVGDRDVLVSARPHGLDEIEQRVLAVAAPVAVQVQVAAQVAGSTSSGRLVGARELELAVVLAQLGRDRLVAEVAVDLVLVAGAEDLAALDVLDAPLRDAHAAPLGVLAHAHVVALRAREVLQQVAVALGRHDAQVELDAVVREHRGLGGAVAEHLGDERLLDQPAPSAPGPSVAAAITSTSPTVSARRRSEPASSARSQAGCARSGSSTVRASSSAWSSRKTRLRGAAPASSCASSCCSLRSPKPGLALQAALARGDLELCQRRDAELLPQAARGLGAEARETDDLDEALGDAPAQLLERRHGARLAELADLRRDRVADVVELGQAALLREASRPTRRSRESAWPPGGRRARGTRRHRPARRDRRAGRTDRRSRHCAGSRGRIVAAAACGRIRARMRACRRLPASSFACPPTTSARTSSAWSRRSTACASSMRRAARCS